MDERRSGVSFHQLSFHRDMFYGDVDVRIPEPKPVERSAGGPAALKEAASLLASAKNPVLVSGGGVTMAGAVPDVVALAEKLQTPVCTSYLHNDAFPKSHSLWMGPLGYQVL